MLKDSYEAVIYIRSKRIRISLWRMMIVLCVVGLVTLLIWKGVIPFFVAVTNLALCAAAVALTVAGLKWKKWYLLVASASVFGEVVCWCIVAAIARRYAEVSSPSIDLPELRFWNNAGFYALIVARCVLLIGAIGFLDEVNRGVVGRRGAAR